MRKKELGNFMIAQEKKHYQANKPVMIKLD